MNEQEPHDHYEVYHGHGVFRVFKIAGMAIGGIAVAVLLAFVFGYVVMWLWNWLMPGLFGLKAITYWQAWGLIVLAKIFFSGGHGSGYHGHHGYGHGRHWKHKHRFAGDWAPNGDYKNWKYYEDYWQAEGKASFEAYLNRTKPGENK